MLATTPRRVWVNGKELRNFPVQELRSGSDIYFEAVIDQILQVGTFHVHRGTKLDGAEVRALVKAAGLSVSDNAIEDWRVLLGSFDDFAKVIMKEDDGLPIPDSNRYIPTDIRIPENTEKGGWATRCTVKSTAPTSALLAGRSVAIKDNTAVAGVRCTNGLPAVNGDWVPMYDATVCDESARCGGHRHRQGWYVPSNTSQGVGRRQR